jgi:hypothetical protein
VRDIADILRYCGQHRVAWAHQDLAAESGERNQLRLSRRMVPRDLFLLQACIGTCGSNHDERNTAEITCGPYFR